jgi:hypothetical protein
MPVNPTKAASAYGQPQLKFMEAHSAFYSNQGSGGPFTKTGTMRDFTPAPNYD